MTAVVKNDCILTCIIFFLFFFNSCDKKEDGTGFITTCNPVDISYRFQPNSPSRREAADPTIVKYKDDFYLFSSKSGGYWHSRDMTGWNFVKTNHLPTEDYAPTAIVIEDTMYFMASNPGKCTVYKSTCPKNDDWHVARDSLLNDITDPAFFYENGKLYLYYGCSNIKPIFGIELDYKNKFEPVGEPKPLIYQDPSSHGWEVSGDYNTLHEKATWIEGAWMNKYKGKYYLQYSAPGTEFKSYADGVYVSNHPLGPFKLAVHNPFSYKPEGFLSGAGHGSSFIDNHGNYWHASTSTISRKHRFERRINIYPLFFDENDIMHAWTAYGDFPLIVPSKKIHDFEQLFPGWMILSYGKNTIVSSSIDTLSPSNMVDENIRTYWAAKSGDIKEWAMIDLGKPYMVFAIQVNFAEHDTKLFNRNSAAYHRYKIVSSPDKNKWMVLVDKSMNNKGNSHPYHQLKAPLEARYIKIQNIEVPDGHFALSGFRIFGKGSYKKPGEVKLLNARRSSKDRRRVHLSWEKHPNTIGYVIKYGRDQNKLYHHYMVYSDTALTINSLHANRDYYFRIESFNENGISNSSIIQHVQ